MNISNKSFKNNITGEIVKVIDAFENIAILENRQKIDVRRLMDPNQFTEQIDPNSFFNNQIAYNELANKIKNISTDNLSDDVSKNVIINTDDSFNEPAIIQTTEEYEREELAKKYGIKNNNLESLKKQNEAFDKLLNGKEEVNEFLRDNVPTKIVNKNIVKEEDPIITMFKNVKRNVDFNINIDFSDKIPRLDFIEMMEDSYNTSIIEYLSDEFTAKILEDPSIIKDKIKDKINELVYKVKNSNLSEIKETSDNKIDQTQEKPKRQRKIKKEQV